MSQANPISRRRAILSTVGASMAANAEAQPAPAGTKPRNILFILTDDHRYDAISFQKAQTFPITPNLDAMAREGVYCRNAFVTTALCSPSRASILTGKYAHQHKIVDNNTAIPPGTHFFPEDLRNAGYATGFFGKWHMGNAGDQPQPGFDRWVSFKGQGTYLPSPNGLNVDGQHVPQKGYITDESTDYALEWLERRSKTQPWFLYLSHKAVHSNFIPAERHKGKYANETFVPPLTMATGGDMARNRPMWVQNQRNSWHGAENPYNTDLSLADYYKRYAETLLAVDESLGRLFAALKQRGELDSTLIVYMGDNGFQFGEHGLIDKRAAYEESMRVPMLARCPELFPGGHVTKEVVAGIDILPTFFAAAGIALPKEIPGRNFLPLLQGKSIPWREGLLYEYYWERNYPQTPTMHAIRGARYKYIHYYGIWDIDELYDLEEDPHETNNLIFSEKHKSVMASLNRQLFDVMESTGAMYIPLYRDTGSQSNKRSGTGAQQSAPFPKELIEPPISAKEHPH